MRKDLHNKLIEDFRNLKYNDSEVKVFYAVEKFLAKIEQYPSCELIPSEVSVAREGLTMDNRFLGFRAIVRDHIEQSRAENSVDYNRRIDRLSDIEDVIFAYLQQVPHPIEHVAEDVQVYRIDVLPARYFYEDTTEGISIYQVTDFSLVLDIHVQNI